MDFGNIWFQKCILSGGDPEHTWRKKLLELSFGVTAVISVKKPFILVLFLSSSSNWAFLEVRFSNFFRGEIFDQIILETT